MVIRDDGLVRCLEMEGAERAIGPNADATISEWTRFPARPGSRQESLDDRFTTQEIAAMEPIAALELV